MVRVGVRNPGVHGVHARVQASTRNAAAVKRAKLVLRAYDPVWGAKRRTCTASRVLIH